MKAQAGKGLVGTHTFLLEMISFKQCPWTLMQLHKRRYRKCPVETDDRLSQILCFQVGCTCTSELEMSWDRVIVNEIGVSGFNSCVARQKVAEMVGEKWESLRPK